LEVSVGTGLDGEGVLRCEVDAVSSPSVVGYQLVG